VHQGVWDGDTKCCPYRLGFGTAGEDVNVRLELTWTVNTPRFLKGPDVSVMEVRPRVKASTFQKPTKEHNFLGQPSLPDFHGFARRSHILDGLVGCTGRKRSTRCGVKKTDILTFIEEEVLKATLENFKLGAGGVGEPIAQVVLEIRDQRISNKDILGENIGVECRESLSQGASKKPAIMPKRSISTIANTNGSQLSVPIKLSSNQLTKVGVMSGSTAQNRM
jgi:hypothetical protein